MTRSFIKVPGGRASRLAHRQRRLAAPILPEDGCNSEVDSCSSEPSNQHCLLLLLLLLLFVTRGVLPRSPAGAHPDSLTVCADWLHLSNPNISSGRAPVDTIGQATLVLYRPAVEEALCFYRLGRISKYSSRVAAFCIILPVVRLWVAEYKVVQQVVLPTARAPRVTTC